MHLLKATGRSNELNPATAHVCFKLITLTKLTVTCCAWNVDSAMVSFSAAIAIYGVTVLTLIHKERHTYQMLHIGPRTYGVWKQVCYKEEDVPVSNQEDPEPDKVLGPTKELFLAEFVPEEVVNDFGSVRTIPAHILIVEGAEKKTEFGSGSHKLELEWIVQEVNYVIKQVMGHRDLSMWENLV